MKKLASFLVHGVLLALHAKLLDLEAVRIITTVLFCNVIAVFAFFACQGDLGTNVAGLAHCSLTSMKHTLMCWFDTSLFNFVCVPIVPDAKNLVARAGLEPATQRL